MESRDRYRGIFWDGRMELHSDGDASFELHYVPQAIVEALLRHYLELRREN